MLASMDFRTRLAATLRAVRTLFAVRGVMVVGSDLRHAALATLTILSLMEPMPGMPDPRAVRCEAGLEPGIIPESLGSASRPETSARKSARLLWYSVPRFRGMTSSGSRLGALLARLEAVEGGPR